MADPTTDEKAKEQKKKTDELMKYGDETIVNCGKIMRDYGEGKTKVIKLKNKLVSYLSRSFF